MIGVASFTIVANDALFGDLKTDVSDPDGDVLTFALVTSPEHGVLLSFNADGTFVYRPDSHYVGSDSFSYSVSDSTPEAFRTAATVSGSVEIAIVSESGNAQLSLEKTANSAGPVRVGDSITYVFAVSNIGTETISGITIDDPKIGTFDCIDSLAVGATGQCSADYAVSQADGVAGNVNNFATASGLTQDGTTVAASDEVNVPVCIPGEMGGVVRALQSDPSTPIAATKTVVSVPPSVTEEPAIATVTPGTDADPAALDSLDSCLAGPTPAPQPTSAPPISGNGTENVPAVTGLPSTGTKGGSPDSGSNFLGLILLALAAGSFLIPLVCAEWRRHCR